MIPGEDLLPVDPPPDTGTTRLAVRGGVGSISFQWEELGLGAQRLRLLADTLRGVLHQCGDLQWRLQMLLKDHPEVDGGGALAVSSVDDARAALSRCDEELRETAQRIDFCRLNYETAEAFARVAAGAANAGMGAVEHQLRWAIETANAGDLAEPTPLSLERTGPIEELVLDGSVQGLLRRIESVNADGPGAFEVLKVRGSDSEVFVVVLPGTQGTEAAATTNPFDPTGVVEAVHYDSAYVAEVVRGALVESGASSGDRVMIVGYSQGGMHAANLAQHPSMTEEFQLEMVLTAGAPTGREPSGNGAVNYLHLEHADDWVTQVEGTANPEERRRVTATLDGPVAETGEEGKGLGAAHKLSTYVAGAEAVDSSYHPSLAVSVGAISAALGRRAPAERHVFTARRRLRDGDRTGLPARPGE